MTHNSHICCGVSAIVNINSIQKQISCDIHTPLERYTYFFATNVLAK